MEFMSDSPVICENVEFSYADTNQLLLRGVNVEVKKGEFVVVAGPSGAGKSTFCRALNNIIPLFFRGPLSGKRRIAGEWLDKQPIAAISKKVGMVFQDFEQQLFSTSAFLELTFGPENFGIAREEIQSRIEELLGKFGISHLMNREPLSLSGGEKQKLAIASVVAYKPEVLVLDEPTTDLDPESREFVLQILPDLKNWVETVILIDHETEQFQTADRVFLFQNGAFHAEGSPQEILCRSDLLESNSLYPLDLVRVQESVGITPQLVSATALAETLRDHELRTIAVPERMKAPPVAEASNLTFQYEGAATPALNGVSFELREGEFIGIFGHNGSGKSTLLRHFNGLQMPQQGQLKILDKDVKNWNRKELAHHVGLVFQNPDHQIFNASVKEELEFGPRQFGFSDEDVRQNAARASKAMDLDALLEKDPFQLSKGERQRVAVASVLSLNPKVLILDEPTTGLDYKQQKYLMELLKEFNRSGTTIIIVTHSLRLVCEYCNYSLFLQKGNVVAKGHPRELFFDPNLKIKPPAIVSLSRLMKGNALSVSEFLENLRRT
jgi:energy-coupling factor transport system ATP-binding protein